MFNKLLKKKRVVVGLSVAMLAIAGAAFAYWTTTGLGSGSGSVKTANGTLVLHGTITNELAPGVSSPVTFTADNSSKSSLEVATVKAVVSIDEVHANAGCKAEDFTINDTAENQVITKESSGVSLTHNGSISMADTAEKQDACKGAEIKLALTS